MLKKYSSIVWKDLIDDWKIGLLLVLPVLCTLAYIDAQNVNVGFLQLHSINEWSYYGSLRYMFNGVIGHKISSLFGYGFYQYGFIYFLINLILVFPALLLHKTAIVIFIPRLVSSLSASIALFYFYKISRRHLDKTTSFLLSCFVVSMPAFWYNAMWFHPDWVMTSLLVISVYYFFKDEWKFKEDFYLAVVFYGLAIAFKYQAITSLPLLFVYVFYEQLSRFNFSKIKERVVVFIKSIVLISGIFIASNPYILHPMGWRVFSSTFFFNLSLGASSESAAENIDIFQKINLVIGQYYFPRLIFYALFIVVFYQAYLFFRRKDKSFFAVISINFLLNILYLLFRVNKAWQGYYLPVILLGIMLFIYLLDKIKARKRYLLLGAAVIIQLALYSGIYGPKMVESNNAAHPDFNDYSQSQNEAINDFIVNNLTGKISTSTVVMISPYTPFEYEKVGLEYERLYTIY